MRTQYAKTDKERYREENIVQGTENPPKVL